MRSLFFVLLLSVYPFGLFAKEAIMPLAEVKPGMQGTWRTVASGTKMSEYRLEVLDIMYGLMAPGVPTIFCKALDEDQIHIGTVAGMSGSPVYIDGKLVGAYALGFPYPKDQALIGVTPIEYMLGILDLDSVPASSTQPALSSAPRSYLAEKGPQACMPLFMNGASEATIRYLNASLPQLGFRAVAAAGSSAPASDAQDSSASSAPEMVAGSALAPILLGGDFLWGGVGTVTMRDGDTVLAFGHPFFDAGPVDVPFASAEIITIVQNYESSFKLPKIGKVIGSLTQDKLTGVLGKLGQKPKTIACTFNLKYPDGTTKTYRGDLCRFWGLSPVIFGGALHSVLTQTLGAQMQQTFFMHTRFEFEGKPTIDLDDVGSGENAVQWLSEITERRYQRLMENPFEAAPLTSVTFDIKVQNGWFDQKLSSIELLGDRTQPGDTLKLAIETMRFHGSRARHIVEIPLPKNIPLSSLSVYVGDATETNFIDRGRGNKDFQSLDDILEYFTKHRSTGAIYVKLLNRDPGLVIGGRSLSGLPSSMLHLLEGGQAWNEVESIPFSTLWETSLPIEGVFTGQHQLPVK